MITLLNKLFSQSKNFNSLNLAFQKLNKESEIKIIFKIIEEFSSNSEIRYVGGCVRKIINYQKVDDIDFAVNLNPNEISEIFKKEGENYFRKLEEKVTLQLLNAQNTIVSLGGGGFINKNIRNQVLENHFFKIKTQSIPF